MTGKHFNKQFEKRQRITKETLVIGMDIGCQFNALCLMSKDGEVLGKYPKIYNTRRGFDYFVKITEEAKANHGLKDVLIGMEPTGHYWRKIAYFAKDCGYEVRFIKTTALKHQRELDESSPSKTDIKDAVVIANIVREGKYIDTVIEDDIFRELRTLCHLRERILRYSIGSKNTLKALLDDYFPEVKSIFYSMESKGLLEILKICPFPEDVQSFGLEKLTYLLKAATRRNATAEEKAVQVYIAAKESVGLKRVTVSDRFRLKTYLKEIENSRDQLKEIEAEIKRLLSEVEASEYMLSIPGIGIISCATLLGELGNPINFKNPKQIVKYAGYDPREDDSGLRIGRKIISKKGRWLLRKCLYFIAMQSIHWSDYFKAYYQKKLDLKNCRGALLTKKEALCAVVIKLVKVIFALLRDGRKFTEKSPSLVLVA
ncbi:MAG: IS110 family transposase [bacterium]